MSEPKPTPGTVRPQAPAAGPASPTLDPASADPAPRVQEIGGRKNGLDPTRYGDWEKNGRCIDF